MSFNYVHFHKAVHALYPNAVAVDSPTEITPATVLDVNGNAIEIDMDAINAWVDPEQYKYDRAAEYPSLAEQLDYIYHNGVEAWKTDIIDPIKARYPKP
jgi:hypothetical protein